jgi:hypothetical protein
MKYNVDIKLNDNGDIEPTQDGDLCLVYNEECTTQTAKNIIKSISKDWFYDEIGADLEALYGMPVEYVKSNGEALISKALTKHNIFGPNEFYVIGHITNKILVVFVVMLSYNGKVIPIETELTISGGIKIK